MTRRLWQCERGGTGFVELMIVLALAAIAVTAGARVYGIAVHDEFDDGADRAAHEITAAPAATADRESATAGANASATEPPPPPPDWRRAIDLLVAVPLALLLAGSLVGWRRRRRRTHEERRRRDEEARRRAARLGAAVSAADGDLVPRQEVAQMVAVHPGGARGP